MIGLIDREVTEMRDHQIEIINVNAAQKMSLNDKGAIEFSRDAYFDMIPDEPVNREAFAYRDQIRETYSYNRYTGTIPAQRVKLEEVTASPNIEKTHKNRLQSRAKTRLQSAVDSVKYRQKNTQLSKTPLMAARYFIR